MLSPLWREFLVVMSIPTLFRISSILAGSYPAVLASGLRNNDTVLNATVEETSLISSAYSMTGALGFFLISPIMQMYGRKVAAGLLQTFLLVGTMVIAIAPNISTIILGRALQGFCFCGFYIVCVITGEYCHPKRRAFYSVFSGIGTGAGLFVCHYLVFSLTWRQIAWLNSIPSIIGLICIPLCPESPSWLAYKSRYDECRVEFEKMRGVGKSKEELKELIVAQKEIRKLKQKANVAKDTLNALRSKDFLRPFVIMTLITSLAHFTGLYYLLAYTLQFINKLTGDRTEVMYYTLAFDVVKLIGIITGSIVTRIVKRRTLLLYGGTISLLLMALVCLFDYLKYAGVLQMNWIVLTVFILFNSVSYNTITALYAALSGELFPIEYKSIGSCLIGIIYSLLGFVLLKATLIMLENWTVYQILSLYLLIGVVILLLLYILVPETKDRTLQNIELEFMELKLENLDVELNEIEEAKLMKKF